MRATSGLTHDDGERNPHRRLHELPNLKLIGAGKLGGEDIPAVKDGIAGRKDTMRAVATAPDGDVEELLSVL